MSENTTCCVATETCDAKTEVSYRRPQYRATPTDQGQELEVFVPGASREQVTVSVDDDVMTITATPNTTVPEGWKPVLEELSKTAYQLRVRLGTTVDRENVRAEVRDGILRLTFPTKEEAKPRTIHVN